MKGDKIMEQIILEKINLEEVVTELLKCNNVYFRNDKGNLTTSAERMFAYLSQDMKFEEEHTGLADALIETQILARCFKSHKSINKKINRACWRICQKVVE